MPLSPDRQRSGGDCLAVSLNLNKSSSTACVLRSEGGSEGVRERESKRERERESERARERERERESPVASYEGYPVSPHFSGGLEASRLLLSDHSRP